MGTVIHTNAWGATIVPFPQEPSASRSEFGLKETDRPPPGIFNMQDGIDRVLDVFNDGKPTDSIKRAGKALQDVLDGKAPEPRKVCPTLLIAAAGRANGIAASARDMARELESLGCIAGARTFYSLADIAETTGAEVEAPAHEGGA